jgi:hypothetical protein
MRLGPILAAAAIVVPAVAAMPMGAELAVLAPTTQGGCSIGCLGPAGEVHLLGCATQTLGCTSNSMFVFDVNGSSHDCRHVGHAWLLTYPDLVTVWEDFAACMEVPQGLLDGGTGPGQGLARFTGAGALLEGNALTSCGGTWTAAFHDVVGTIAVDPDTTLQLAMNGAGYRAQLPLPQPGPGGTWMISNGFCIVDTT